MNITIFNTGGKAYLALETPETYLSVNIPTEIFDKLSSVFETRHRSGSNTPCVDLMDLKRSVRTYFGEYVPEEPRADVDESNSYVQVQLRDEYFGLEPGKTYIAKRITPNFVYVETEKKKWIVPVEILREIVDAPPAPDPLAAPFIPHKLGRPVKFKMLSQDYGLIPQETYSGYLYDTDKVFCLVNTKHEEVKYLILPAHPTVLRILPEEQQPTPEPLMPLAELNALHLADARDAVASWKPERLLPEYVFRGIAVSGYLIGILHDWGIREVAQDLHAISQQPTLTDDQRLLLRILCKMAVDMQELLQLTDHGGPITAEQVEKGGAQ